MFCKFSVSDLLNSFLVVLVTCSCRQGYLHKWGSPYKELSRQMSQVAPKFHNDGFAMAAPWMNFINLQAIGDAQLTHVVFYEGEEDNSEVDLLS